MCLFQAQGRKALTKSEQPTILGCPSYVREPRRLVAIQSEHRYALLHIAYQPPFFLLHYDAAISAGYIAPQYCNPQNAAKTCQNILGKLLTKLPDMPDLSIDSR